MFKRAEVHFQVEFNPSLPVHLRTIKTISGNRMSIKVLFRWDIRTRKTCTTRKSFSNYLQGHEQRRRYRNGKQLQLQSGSTLLSCFGPWWWLFRPRSHVSIFVHRSQFLYLYKRKFIIQRKPTHTHKSRFLFLQR